MALPNGANTWHAMAVRQCTSCWQRCCRRTPITDTPHVMSWTEGRGAASRTLSWCTWSLSLLPQDVLASQLLNYHDEVRHGGCSRRVWVHRGVIYPNATL